MSGRRTTLPYRPELDGLRAIAVCSVLLFHSGLAWAKGGFIGVDVFFVLSGYLMTRIILGDTNGKEIQIWRFFARRAQRIFPAFFVVLLIATILFWPILTPSEINEFGRYLAGSSVFLSNFYYGLRFAYFSAEGLQNPLLHTWSISIEVQFYLIAPLVLLSLAKLGFSKTNILICVGGLSILSFMSFILQYATNPQTAYYSLSARLWEFGLGSSCALLCRLPARLDFLAPWIAAAGLSLIGVAALGAVPDASVFEENILLAALGTSFVLFSGSRNVIARSISIPPLLFLGKISYSIYLIHWPLFLFYKMWTFKYELSLLEIFLLTIATVAISYLSWRIIEAPASSKRQVAVSRTFTRYAIVAICVFSLGLLLRQWTSQGAPELVKLSNYTTEYLSSERFSNQFEARGEQCFLSDKTESSFSFSKLDSCLERSAHKPALYLIGDSHAAALTGPIMDVFPTFDMLPVLAVGCRFLRPYSGSEKCQTVMERTATQTLPEAEKAVVVIASRWTMHENKFGRAALLLQLEQTIMDLRATSQHTIVIVGPNPEFFFELPILLARAEMLGRDANSIRPSQQSKSLNGQMRERVQQSGAIYVDVFSEFCKSERCEWILDAGPTHFDSNHLTDKAAGRVAKAINRALIAADQL